MKKYSEVYNSIKENIENKQYKAGDKIPSVRRGAEIFGVSTTTVKNAYFDLCADGYVIAHEKSGYFVAELENKTIKENDCAASSVKYDFNGGTADSESFDFSLWQRYIKSALRQTDRMLSYSEAKGEYDLRCAISDYIREKRNVIASPDRIIIGAGVQPLLHILCSLLDKGGTVSFPDDSFIQGRYIFGDSGFNLKTRYKDADIIYVSPSHMTRWGDVMPIKRRLELVEYSDKNGSIVIEDDYENDFLYNIKPTPSLYALGKGNVVYLGSFSQMLLPAIRISFMVLTDELIERYNKQQSCFAQTASKTEQIALCQYIRDGHINSQIRKIRRIYSQKTRAFFDILKSSYPDAEISISENTLQVIMKTAFGGSIGDFEREGLSLYAEKYENGFITLVLSPSGIPYYELDNAVKELKKVTK